MPSSGNVYKDLGFKYAEAMLAKAWIVAEIVRIIRARRLTRTAAAKILALSQPRISALVNGHFQSYSHERLMCLRDWFETYRFVKPALAGVHSVRIASVESIGCARGSVYPPGVRVVDPQRASSQSQLLEESGFMDLTAYG